jgi:hypothetical protein
MTSDDDDDDLVSFVSRDIALGANTANENLGILLRGRFLFVFSLSYRYITRYTYS